MGIVLAALAQERHKIVRSGVASTLPEKDVDGLQCTDLCYHRSDNKMVERRPMRFCQPLRSGLGRVWHSQWK